jgi:hypothetical protein
MTCPHLEGAQGGGWVRVSIYFAPLKIRGVRGSYKKDKTAEINSQFNMGFKIFTDTYHRHSHVLSFSLQPSV